MIPPLLQTARKRRSLGINAWPPELLVGLGVLTTQLGSAAATGLFDTLGPMGTAVWRLVLSALVLLAVARPAVRALTAADWRAVALFGLVLAGMNVCFYQAIARLPLGVAVSVEFCGPLGVAAALSRGPREIAAAGLAVLGLGMLAPWGEMGALLGEGAADETLIGFAFALAAGLCWAGYIVLGARASRRVAGMSGLALAIAIGALAALPFGVATSGAGLLAPLVTPWLIAAALGVALLSSALPYGFEYLALPRISARTFSLLLCAEPAVAALIGLALLGDRLGALAWAGLACVTAAAFNAALAKRPSPPVATDPS